MPPWDPSVSQAAPPLHMLPGRSQPAVLQNDSKEQSLSGSSRLGPPPAPLYLGPHRSPSCAPSLPGLTPLPGSPLPFHTRPTCSLGSSLTALLSASPSCWAHPHRRPFAVPFPPPGPFRSPGSKQNVALERFSLASGCRAPQACAPTSSAMWPL